LRTQVGLGAGIKALHRDDHDAEKVTDTRGENSDLLLSEEQALAKARGNPNESGGMTYVKTFNMLTTMVIYHLRHLGQLRGLSESRGT
jgi:hypothetical protein